MFFNKKRSMAFFLFSRFRGKKLKNFSKFWGQRAPLWEVFLSSDPTWLESVPLNATIQELRSWKFKFRLSAFSVKIFNFGILLFSFLKTNKRNLTHNFWLTAFGFILLFWERWKVIGEKNNMQVKLGKAEKTQKNKT